MALIRLCVLTAIAVSACAQGLFSLDWPSTLPGTTGLPAQTPTVTRPMERAVLEGAVDPETYVVGPGDRLVVNVWGDFEQTFDVSITPEGTLLIPTIGVVDVRDSTLAAVRRTVEASARKVYRTGRVTTTLMDVRMFRVHVAGAVAKPGSYFATAVDRVSDVLAQATDVEVGSESDTALVLSRLLVESDRIPASRNIVVYRGDDTLHVDLQMFQRAGFPDLNPNVRDGDVILVPAVSRLIDKISISGAVRYPGEFEFVPGDSLGSLLMLAHGLTPDAQRDSVEVVRFTGSESKREFRVSLDDAGFPLQADDRVYARWPSGFHTPAEVQVTGRVHRPGYYSIVEGETTLSDLIRMTGGFLPDASLTEATLVRRATEEVADPEFDRLQKMLVADMNELEYAYFKTRSREIRGRVAVDFRRLFEGGDSSQDRLLRHRDVITIPRQTRTVTVAGEVRNPGIQPYIDGMDVRYYVDQAGGYTNDSRKSRMRVIRAATGEWAGAGDKTGVYVGDTIWIPSKPDRDWWTAIKDVVGFAASAATLIVVIDQLRR